MRRTGTAAAVVVGLFCAGWLLVPTVQAHYPRVWHPHVAVVSAVVSPVVAVSVAPAVPVVPAPTVPVPIVNPGAGPGTATGVNPPSIPTGQPGTLGQLAATAPALTVSPATLQALNRVDAATAALDGKSADLLAGVRLAR